jgi:RNA polymerase sigma-70 factor, ECF subfamily
MAADLGQPSARSSGVTEPPDHSLLEALREGDRDAATLLYRRYAKRLRQLIRAKCSPQLARRVDAEDIMQSVFYAFFRGASGGCYAVPAGEELWPLLLVIALNKIRTQGSFHRAAKRDVRVTLGLDDTDALHQAINQLEVDEPLPFLNMIARETLERMPLSQREIVELRVAGYEVEEIALKVGRSKRTVERLLQACRHELSAMLAEVESDGTAASPPESSE